MDGDLQDPPELIPRMLALYAEGFDIVSPQRSDRREESVFKRLTASWFYWIMQKLVDRRVTPEVGDFRLFSSRALAGIRAFREQHRFVRGLVAWLGLREAFVPYERKRRRSGATKYPFWKMVAFAWTAISSFSGLPLRLAVTFGMLLTVVGLLGAVWVILQTLLYRQTVWGWSSLVVLQCGFSGAILFSVGLLGEYVARIYDETKARPLYVVTSTLNISAVPPQVRAIILPPAAEPKPASRFMNPTKRTAPYDRPALEDFHATHELHVERPARQL
jgi:dolichol-phosphate mannosyltransferase